MQNMTILLILQFTNKFSDTCINCICKPVINVGYLACARCSASGMILSIKPVSIREGHSYPFQPPSMSRCPNCSGAGKVFVSFIPSLLVCFK
jgi:RecJ-like exonuclease